MGSTASEKLCPHRYEAPPGTGLLVIHTRLEYPQAAGDPTTVQLSLAVIDMFDTEHSRGALAMEAAAWLEGRVTLQRLGKVVNLREVVLQCQSEGSEDLIVVVWVPSERLHDLEVGDYLAGVDAHEVPPSCVVVTDAPGAVIRGSSDIVIGVRNDPVADAIRVTRMVSSFQASHTLSGADILDFSYALASGSFAVLVDVFWSEAAPNDIQFGSPEDAALVASTKAAVMTLHVPITRTSKAWLNAPVALRRHMKPDVSWQFTIAAGQRVDQLDTKVRHLDVLCAVPIDEYGK